MTNALKAANGPATPVGRDAANGFVKALVAQKIVGISISTSPGQGPVALRAAIALLQALHQLWCRAQTSEIHDNLGERQIRRACPAGDVVDGMAKRLL